MAGFAGQEHRIQVELRDDATAAAHPLLPLIERRSVDRRPYQMTPLSAARRQALAAAGVRNFLSMA